MKYELDLLAALVHKELSLSGSENEHDFTSLFAPHYQRVADIICESRNYLRHHLVEGNTARLATLVPLAQRDTVRALDALDKYIENPTPEIPLHRAAHEYRLQLSGMLKDLLEYLYVDFGDFYDIFQKIPAGVIRKKEPKVKRFYGKLMSVLNESFPKETFYNVFLHPFNLFFDQQYPTSHYHLIYMRQLRKKYYEHLFEDLETHWDAAWLMIRLRLNSHEAVKFCIETITTLLMQEPEKQRYDFLKKLFQEVDQVYIEDMNAYLPQLPELKIQVLDFVASLLTTYECVNKQQQAEAEIPEDFFLLEKIIVSFTVDELGFLLMLMWESGMIINENYLNVVTAATKSFSTRRKKHIAYESLRVKSYTPEPGAADKVQNKLMILFNKAKGR